MQEKAFYKGGNGLDVSASVRPRSVDTLEGSRLWGKEISSPDSECGEQWMQFSKVNLLPAGRRIQGARKHSTMLSADVCLFVCLSSALRVRVCAGIVSGPPPPPPSFNLASFPPCKISEDIRSFMSL